MDDTWVKLHTPNPYITAAAECTPLSYSINWCDEVENIFIVYIVSGKKGDAGKEYKNS